MKQAKEFGILAGGTKIAALAVTLSDIKAIGLDTVQGMLHTEAFYWDFNDESRAFTRRFIEKRKIPPSQAQAGSYSAVLNYLRAIEKTKTDDAGKVIAQMKSAPFSDAFTPHGYVRADGRMVHDMYLVRSRKPSEPKGDWDLYDVVKVIPGDQAFRPIDKGGCPLVSKP
jgi:branched-chain amino acid transport system substrate-binding protein